MAIIDELARRIGRLEKWAREHMAFEPTNSTCQVYIKGAQAIATGAPQDVLFDVEVYDPDDLHSLVANTDRITIIVPGVYVITAYASWEQHDTGTRRIRITVNAATVSGQEGDTGGATITHDQSASHQRLLAASDIVRLEAYQTSGGDLNLDACSLEVTRIS